MFLEIEKFGNYVNEFNKYQKKTVPLCAAENVLSDFCKLALSADFQERYIMGSSYQYTRSGNFIGSEHLLPFYDMISDICGELFHCKYTDVRTLTGMNCLTMVLMAIAKPGDKIMILDAQHGGHASVHGICERLGLTVYNAPYDLDHYDFDYDLLNEQVKQEGIKFILPAPSDLIAPMDVKRIDDSQAILLFDASQTLGFIAAGLHENPLDVMKNIIVFGGTHKSLPGPAHGLVLTNNEEIFSVLDKGINPKYLRNTQMHQVICLLLCLIEAKYFGEAYQKNTIHLSNVLAQKLADRHFTIASKEGVYSQTHQVFWECNQPMMQRIFDHGFQYGVTLNTKTKELFHGGYGIRLGLQEVSRYAWDENSMELVAELLQLLSQESFTDSKALEIIKAMPEKNIHYTFDQDVYQALQTILK